MEQSLSFITYKGSIPAAIAEAKKQRKLFVVFISGEDAESNCLEKSSWTDSKVVESVLKYCILLHLSEGSKDAVQFSAIYPHKSIPCVIAVGYNGVQVWQNEGFVSAEVLASSLEKAWLSLHIQDTTAAVLSAALAIKASEPSSSRVASTASSDQGSSNLGVQSPLTDKSKSPDSITKVDSDNKKEDQIHQCTVEEKSCELGDATSSEFREANKTACADDEKCISTIKVDKELHCRTVADLDNTAADHSSTRVIAKSLELKKVTGKDLDVSDGGSKSLKVSEVEQDEKEKAVDGKKATQVDSCAKVNKMNDVYLNIHMPNGGNLQGKFSVSSTMRMVKEYVDENQDSIIGSFDLATPYPRKVYSGQDLSKTLSDLGLFDRQALIVVPHQRVTDQPISRNIVESSNESTDGYFAYAKRMLSFINPFSYLGGGSSSTNSGHQSQPGMWEYSPVQNDVNQEQRPRSASPQSISAGIRNDSKKGQLKTSRFGSNIHTLKHDEDDERFNDRNSFWNGNSTQYGGNDNGK
ncbi:plant UBX domain-containing protein 11 [Humulus lupulus]|uniref:plant UBX domain-containing protein 11 n=1 Tax=Humulus lupulus TaxID=3486 RepID=UPI002B407068|nr:plant UBX domain-containing protein 11 [Humulus lupulus]